jgi:hypothetical protein
MSQNLIKCPNCGDTISGLARVCPSCDYILADRKIDSQLDELVINLEDNLSKLKSIPHSSVIQTIKDNKRIMLILICILLMVAAVKFKFPILGIIGLLVLLFSTVGRFFSWLNKSNKDEEIEIKMKRDKESQKSNQQIFKDTKASIEKNNRIAKTYYGNDKKVSMLLDDINQNVIQVEAERKKGTKINTIVYAVFGVFCLVILVFPEQKSEDEKRKSIEISLQTDEKPLFQKAIRLLKENKVEEAEVILSELKSESYILQLKSNIQLKELETKFEEIESLIEKKNYSKASFELSKAIWNKNSTSFGEEWEMEKQIYNVYFDKKSALNNLLPEKHRVEIKSWYSL